MNISSISSNTNTYLPTQSDNEIRALEKQKERLQAQIQKTKESDTDTQTKQELIKQLQEQMQQIETQIQQKRSEKLSEKLEQSESNQENYDQSNTTETENSAKGISARSMTDFFEASNTYEQSKLMSDTKEKLNGRGEVLSQEIALNEARGVDSTGKRSELAELKARSMNLNIDIGEALHDSKEQAGNTAETEIANNAESNKGVNRTDAEAEETKASTESAESQNEETAASEQEQNAQQVWIVNDRNKKVNVLV